MSNFIFFKSCPAPEGSFLPLLKILPHQTITTPKGEHFDARPDWRVAHAMNDVVQSYNDGTAFACPEEAVIVNSNRSVFSISGTDLKPVGGVTVRDFEHEPSQQAIDAFARYTAAHPDWAKDSVESETPGTPKKAAAPKTETVLEAIHREHPVPSISDDSFFVTGTVWDQLVRNVKYRKRPTMLTGPTGTGKTELILKLAEKLGLPVSVYDMGSMHDPLAQLIGQQGLVNGEKGSITEFQYSSFTDDIQKPGIILLDEISRAPQQANNILFPLLDRRRSLYAEMAGDKSGRIITAHPDCCIVATANIGSAYTGTETMDEALVNRFDSIELDYLSADNEAALLTKVTGIKPASARIIADVCQDVRRKFSESKVSRPLSTRQSILAAENVADGWDLRQAMVIAFEHLFDGTGGSSSERAVVHAVICSK